MKNKSKLAKIKQGNAGAKSVPQEWFYMNPEVITVRDIKDALENRESGALEELSIEIWDEACVLELEIPDAKSMMFEQLEADLDDEYSNAFLKEHGVKTLFGVSIDTEKYEKMRELMKVITERRGGFFCGDTDDFKPVI